MILKFIFRPVIREIHKARTQIMSAISNFAAKVTAHQDKIDASVDGIASDISELKALIEQLQNSPGEITPEDQALLDQIEVRLAQTATKVSDLDALTPPTA